MALSNTFCVIWEIPAFWTGWAISHIFCLKNTRKSSRVVGDMTQHITQMDRLPASLWQQQRCDKSYEIMKAIASVGGAGGQIKVWLISWEMVTLVTWPPVCLVPANFLQNISGRDCFCLKVFVQLLIILCSNYHTVFSSCLDSSSWPLVWGRMLLHRLEFIFFLFVSLYSFFNCFCFKLFHVSISTFMALLTYPLPISYS